MLELNENNVVESVKCGRFLLMFYTDWCPLCPPIIEILQKLEQTESGKFQFAKINFDSNPEAVKNFGIPGVPVVLAVNGGEVLQGWAGLTDADAYLKIVTEVLNSAPQ